MEEDAWAIARQQATSGLQCLGIQDDPCKWGIDDGASGQEQSGKLLGGRITKTIFQEKRGKDEGHIRAILNEYLLHKDPAFSYESFLEQVHDFLYHLSVIFDQQTTLLLKGFHLTLADHISMLSGSLLSRTSS